MKKIPIIKPTVITALCNTHVPATAGTTTYQAPPQQQPQPEKKSVWERAVEIIKSIGAVIVPLIGAVAGLVRAMSYFSGRRSHGRMARGLQA